MSLEQQETACRDYCERMGYGVVGKHSDPGVSASRNRMTVRPGGRRVLAAIENDDADVIVCWKLSRLARNRLDYELAKELIADHGGRWESATEVNDTSPSGRFAEGMLAEFAVFEAAQIGENWRTTHSRRRKAGLVAQGGDRYGYSRKGDRYEVDQEQAEVLRWMYDRVIEGRGATWIAAELNRRGHRNRLGLLWAQHRVYPLLDSGFAAGLLVHHPRDEQNRKVGDATYGPGAHPAIITTAVWEKYRSARRARAGRPARTVEARYPLTGLVKCGDCGAGMWPARAKHGGAGHTLVCGRWSGTRTSRCVTVARHRAEAAVREFLAGLADDVERAAAADTSVRRALQRAQRNRRHAATRVTEVTRQLAELELSALRGAAPDAWLSARDQLLSDLQRAQADVESADAAAVTRPPQAHRTAAGLLEEWDLLPAAQVRNLVSTLVARVEVFPPERPHGRSTLRVVPVWGDG